MSPEVLRCKMDSSDMGLFEKELKKTDSYSMSLVVWEILTRTVLYEGMGAKLFLFLIALIKVCYTEEPDPYQLPYEKYVSDPSVEEMVDIVCRQELRPLIPIRYYDIPVSSYFVYFDKSSLSIPYPYSTLH